MHSVFAISISLDRLARVTPSRGPLRNGLILVSLVQFGLSLLDQSFWNIVFFQGGNLKSWLLDIYFQIQKNLYF